MRYRTAKQRKAGGTPIVGAIVFGFFIAAVIADALPRIVLPLIADKPENSTVYYSGCNAARAAGAAPIYSWEPGYRPEMDGDGDGIACERPRYR